MTVVLEDQVKTIAAEISEQFYSMFDHHDPTYPVRDDEIEDLVRAVIAQYDISNIPQRLQRTKDCVSAHRSFVLQCVDD
jgi:hypothetical protein